MSDKQSEILTILKQTESATLNEICEKITFGYYHNTKKYVGEILSRMVKRGKIERVKKGTFKIKRQHDTNPNQISLL